MKYARHALTGASTIGFVFLGLVFSVISFGAVFIWLDNGGSGLLLSDILNGTVAVLAIAAMFSIVVTGILQIRIPKPRLTKLTAYLTLGWPIYTFGLYAIFVLILGTSSDLSFSYAKGIATDALRLIPGFVAIIGVALILPLWRNSFFQRNKTA